MGLVLDLDELVDRASLLADVAAAFVHSVLSAVEKQVQRPCLVLSADELQDRAVDAVDPDLCDLGALVPPIGLRVELDLDLLRQAATRVYSVSVTDLEHGWGGAGRG